MSLATRCTSCGTIFRVVQDQLKVSEGWVRCGRCDSVFNALEGLFDLTREAPPKFEPRSPPATSTAVGDLPAAASESVATAPPAPIPPAPEDVAELDEDDRIASRFFDPQRDEAPRSPAEAVAEHDRREFADAQFPTELLESHGVEPDKPMPTPTFVREAQRAARWRQPLPRALLSIAALLLFAALVLQYVHFSRDLIAARWPGAAPVLARWCALAHCTLQPPQRIDDIAVESTALARANGSNDTFRLAVTLRNRGTLPLALPSLELALTDSGGQLIARRVMTATEFGYAAPALAPGAEAALQALIATDPRVVGYTVEAFYP